MGQTLSVGQIVAECLAAEGIQYEWDGTAASPILVRPDPSLTGISPKNQQEVQEVYRTQDHRFLDTGRLPETVFDSIEGNPVRILNIARLRAQKLDYPLPRGSRRQPKVGDTVKLGFHVPGAVHPLAREECGEVADLVQVESMWVEVTFVEDRDSQRLYRGELTGMPLFIDPARLRLGSPVSFTAEHVYPGEETPATRAARRRKARSRRRSKKGRK